MIMQNDILTGYEVFGSSEHFEHYRRQYKLDTTSMSFELEKLYIRDIQLGIGKYTVKQAENILQQKVDQFVKNWNFYPKIIKCSVEFYDSLRTKFEWSKRPILFINIPIRPIYKQTEDIILE